MGIEQMKPKIESVVSEIVQLSKENGGGTGFSQLAKGEKVKTIKKWSDSLGVMGLEKVLEHYFQNFPYNKQKLLDDVQRLAELRKQSIDILAKTDKMEERFLEIEICGVLAQLLNKSL